MGEDRVGLGWGEVGKEGMVSYGAVWCSVV